MSRTPDIEIGREYKPLHQDEQSTEDEALLPTPGDESVRDHGLKCLACAIEPRYGILHLSLAFIGGLLVCAVAQFFFTTLCLAGRSATSPSSNDEKVVVAAPTYAGSTTVHNFPPISPTNAYTSLFPTNVGYAGITPTGGEPGVVATAPSYPVHTGAPQLVTPTAKGGAKGSKEGFDMFKRWGNLSPWYSIERGTFGVDSSPEAPEGCVVTGLHFLHRHGARYPTAWGTSSPLYHVDKLLNVLQHRMVYLLSVRHA